MVYGPECGVEVKRSGTPCQLMVKYGHIIIYVRGIAMKKQRIALLLLASMLFTTLPQTNPVSDMTVTAQAHGGRTDSNGGHRDNKNASGLGSYHYHCGGYPAHLHTDGVCPYRSTAAVRSEPAPSSPAGDEGEPAPPQVEAVQQITPGWHKDETGWKYYYPDLTWAKGKWELISDIYYCFDDNGYLYVNTDTPDGYWVNENGEWNK